MTARTHRFGILKPGRSRAQALVELALVMPLLLGIIAVLFQFGILFISYQTLIHMTRDAGRWLAVHPDTIDSDVLVYVNKDLPNSVIVPTSTVGPAWSSLPSGALGVDFTPTCGTFNSSTKRCTTDGVSALSRPAGSLQTITITYDAASRMFLPAVFKLGWLNVPMPGSIQSYSYNLMVEPD
jgi:Flp pilus assembly protein TadG